MNDHQLDRFEHPNYYTVWLKRGGPAYFQAFGCTEAKREKRIYFHLQKDGKDREVFFRAQEIVGVTVEGKIINSPSREEVEKWFKENCVSETPPTESAAA